MAETDTTQDAAEGVARNIPPPELLHVDPPEEPYDAETLKSIEEFFKRRAKNPSGYTYTENGDLETKQGAKWRATAKPDNAGVIRLKRFVPLEPSDRANLEEYRLDAIAGIELEYDEERKKLNDAWNVYRASGSMFNVLVSNERMAELDAIRSSLRSAVRDIIMIDNPAVKEIMLEQRYEERKMFSSRDPFYQELARLCFYDFKAYHDMGKYISEESVAEQKVSAAEEESGKEANEILYRQTLKDGNKARIFFDTDSDVNRFLSPMAGVDFTMNDTRYSCAIQAYESERARELGLEALSDSILKTRSPHTIRLLTRKVVGNPVDAKGLWLKIYTAMYEQTSVLRKKLLDTGTDTLIYADVREGPSGIGLAEKDSRALDRTKWMGENAVGLAQETVRTRLREGNLVEAPGTENVKKSVITEEEQGKAKVGAIINVRRNGRPTPG